MRFNRWIALSVLLTTTSATAERLSSRSLDIGKVEKIYLGPGLISIVDFPEEISEVSTGAPQVFKVSISSVHATELLIQITSQRPFPSNLIVRTVKRTFVFDLIPSLLKHQDVVKVRSGFGSLNDSSRGPKVIERGEFR